CVGAAAGRDPWPDRSADHRGRDLWPVPRRHLRLRVPAQVQRLLRARSGTGVPGRLRLAAGLRGSLRLLFVSRTSGAPWSSKLRAAALRAGHPDGIPNHGAASRRSMTRSPGAIAAILLLLMSAGPRPGSAQTAPPGDRRFGIARLKYGGGGDW